MDKEMKRRNFLLTSLAGASAVVLGGCGGGGDQGTTEGETATGLGTTTQADSVKTALATEGLSDFDTLYPADFALLPLAVNPLVAVPQPTVKAKSLQKVSYIDPTFKTRVYKATDASDFATAGYVRHDYSRRQAFNADNTRYIAQTSDGYWLLYDANNFKRLSRSGFGGSLVGLAGDAEPVWHPTDPTLLYFNAGLIWYLKNVENDTNVDQFDFTGKIPWPQATQVWTKAEGTSSANGRYWAFIASTYDSAASAVVPYGLLTFDALEKRIIGTLDAAVFNRDMPDHIGITPSGKYAVPSWAFDDAGKGTRAYTLDFSSYSTLLPRRSEHSDLAVGPAGEDLFIVADYDIEPGIRVVNVETGASFELMKLYLGPDNKTSYSAHLCGKAYGRRGWAVISTYADNDNQVYPSPKLFPMFRKIMLVELKPGGRQYTIAYTQAVSEYCSPPGDDGRRNCYIGEAHATVSRDGSRIMFASNFNTGGYPSSYMIGLPSWVYR